tara:strand:+ start:275 stop:421 length:147 start_codon:yes stop_codon:yes gene_type:complete
MASEESRERTRKRRNLAVKYSKYKPKKIKPATAYTRKKYRLTDDPDLG